MIQVILDKPPKGFFEKLGNPPWEEKYARLIRRITGTVWVLGSLVVLLEFLDTILKSLVPGIFS